MYNGIPITYPQATWPYTQTQQVQSMTPPTIHADIIQIGSEEDAWNQNVPVGSSQMMMLRDDSAIYIKSVYADKQPTMEVYRRDHIRPREPASDYVTREEFTKAMEGLKTQNKAVKKEAVE